MDYLMVVNAPCYQVSDASFATKSAFAEHVRLLRRMWASRFPRLVIAAPAMSRDIYEQRLNYWGVLHADSDGIDFVPMHPTTVGRVRYFLRYLVPNIFRLQRVIKQAGIVHSGPSHIYYPFGFIAILLGVAAHKPTIFVVDVDERHSSWMNYKIRCWSPKSYLLARCIYDPFRSFQT